MYTIKPTTRFQKDLKRIQKRGYDLSLLSKVIKTLAAGEALPEKNVIINLAVIMLAAENVIYCLTGCWSTR